MIARHAQRAIQLRDQRVMVRETRSDNKPLSVAVMRGL
jgi:hypothetical protein